MPSQRTVQTLIDEHFETWPKPDKHSNAKALARMRGGVHYDQTPTELADAIWFVPSTHRPPQPSTHIRWQRRLPPARRREPPRPIPPNPVAVSNPKRAFAPNANRKPTAWPLPRVTMCITTGPPRRAVAA